MFCFIIIWIIVMHDNKIRIEILVSKNNSNLNVILYCHALGRQSDTVLKP